MHLLLRRVRSASLALLATSACAPLPADNEHLEGPVAGLTHEQRHAFVLGDVLFERSFTAAEGLGPRFNEASCSSCHAGDGAGHPKTMFLRFGRLDEDGFDPLSQLGGPQLQDKALPGYAPEVLPEEANVVAGLIGPPVTGLGFLETVDDETLLALADPEDEDGDGISGRVQWLPATDTLRALAERDRALLGEGSRFTEHEGAFIGRFGRKAGTISLLHQTVVALRDDMGLTSPYAPTEGPSPGDGGFPFGDSPQIEFSHGQLNALTFYMKTLRAPERRNAHHPTVLRGEEVFHTLGCTSCHLPSLTTGDSPIAALHRVEFHPYTDLLLHDMGEALNDGYTEGRADPSEWRTSPLWGFGLRAAAQGGQMYLLHDGRARSLEEAVEYHGGEAAAAAARYRALPNDDRDALLQFLMSL